MAAVAAAMAACVLAQEEGIAVELSIKAAEANGDAGIASGWIHIGEARLVRCSQADGLPSSQRGTRTGIYPWTHYAAEFLSPAKARADHGTVLGTVLDTPQVIPLDAGERPLGTLIPTQGSYCAVALTVIPATAASLGLENPTQIGFSLEQSLERPEQRTVVQSFAQGVWIVPLPSALTLDDLTRSANVIIHLEPSWLLSDPGDSGAGFAAFESLRTSAHAVVTEY